MRSRWRSSTTTSSSRSIPERPVDYVLHLAGIASPYYYRKWPLETLEVATTGLKNVLELRQGERRAAAVLLVERDLRRPGRGPRAHQGELSRPRLLPGRARLLRRVQAARRDARSHLPDSVRRQRDDRPAVQRVRAWHAEARLPRAAQLRRADPRRGANQRLRQRPADTHLLLRHRRHPRLPAGAAGRAAGRAVQHRQAPPRDLDAGPGRDDRPRACRSSRSRTA